MKFLYIISFVVIFFSINTSIAQMPKQYFIKISPSDSKVRYGEFMIKKHSTTLNYHTVENKPDIITPDKALQWINKEIQGDNPEKKSKVLFFIHGFWGSLTYAIDITSEAFDKYYFNGDSSNVVAIIHIIWKAHGITYKQAIKSINNSSKTLATLINSIPETIDKNYSLMCHSMGARFLFKTISTNIINTKFQELILIAPDLDYKKFEENISLFLKTAPKIYVFINSKDKVLLISKTINKTERLGRIKDNKNTDNIKFIDCTEINDTGINIDIFVRHLYFLYSKKVREKIEDILS